MNYVLSIINPEDADTLQDILEGMNVSFCVTMLAHGTATKSMMNLLGIESKERRVVAAVMRAEDTHRLIQEQKRRMSMGAPGHGIMVAIPIKSVGGGRTLAYLNNGEIPKNAPNMVFSHELIMVVANEGHINDVMDAAREAGASGGTILHGKGANAHKAQEFFQMSFAAEKEVLLIVSKAEQKAAIMQSILKKSSGTENGAGAIVFSLPVSEVGGFSLTEN